MSDTPSTNLAGAEQAPKSSCAVCWEDFSQLRDLDNHIRASHPDRISKPEEFFARREVA